MVVVVGMGGVLMAERGMEDPIVVTADIKHLDFVAVKWQLSSRRKQMFFFLESDDI